MPNIRLVVAFFLLVLLIMVPANAQQNPDLASPSIIINLPSRTLEFYSGNTLVKEYPIAIGKPSTPTPLGDYYIMNKEVNPAWYPPRGGYVVPSGPDNPLGYRWMGFLPMYGIHGTNAPWAIGLAVSNGCIRMHEEDVEELFEVIPYGTPVKVAYERVKVRVDRDGLVSIGIYADIYGYHDVTVEDVRTKLADQGLTGIVNEDMIAEMIAEEADKQIAVARLGRLVVNDKVLVERVIVKGSTTLVPIMAVASALNINVTWNEAVQTVTSPRQSVPAVVYGERLYVTAENARLLVGGQHVWTAEDNTFAINLLTAFVNGKLLSRDVDVVENVLAIPVLPLAEALGQKVIWHKAQNTVTLGKQLVPVSLVQNQPYIQITKIAQYFRAYVYWNIPARSIDITYPFNFSGGGSD